MKHLLYTIVLLTLISASKLHAGPGGTNRLTDEESRRITGMLAMLPSFFMENKGQWESKIQYRASANGVAVSFLEDGLSFCSGRELEEESEGEDEHAEKRIQEPYEYLVWNLRFRNASASPEILSFDKQDSRANFLLGNDPSKYVLNVPEYSMIQYKEVYPQTDIRFYGISKETNLLKYDIVLKPGARMEDIQFAYEGINKLSVNDKGEMVVEHAWGVIKDEAPYSYQLINGEKQEVDVRYVITGGHTFGYKAFGPYDLSQELVIDPFTLVWGTYTRATASRAYCYDIALDGSGYAYITGDCDGTYPTTAGVYQAVWGGGFEDAYVTKFNYTGSSVVYTTYIGGNGQDQGWGIAVNGSGEVYITGQTISTNFPTAGSPSKTTNPGFTAYDAFVAKLNAAGTGLIYSTYIGGASSMDDDIAYDIALDNSGLAYVTGYTNAYDFPYTGGVFQTAHAGGGGPGMGFGLPRDAFVVKISNTGALSYSTYLGGADDETANGIAVNASGEAFVTGFTFSSNFPRTGGAFQTVKGGTASTNDAFVTKLNATGTALSYSTFLGGSTRDIGSALYVNTSSEAYVTGQTQSTNFPTTGGVYQASIGGGYDAFITRLNATGTARIFSTLYGGGGSEASKSIAVGGTGTIYIAGSVTTGALPGSAGNYQASFGGGSYDMFMVHMNATGSALGCGSSTYIGGSADDYTEPRVALFQGTADTLLMAGTTHSSNFPAVTGGSYQSTKLNNSAGDQAVMFKMYSCPAALPLEWLSFTGRAIEEVNLLEWSVAGDDMFSGFTVERGTAGTHFIAIGSVPAISSGSYAYQDAEAGEGTDYYRLRQDNYDGTHSYSQVISVARREDFGLSIVRAHGMLEVIINLPSASAANRLTVFNTAGQKVFGEEMGPLPAGSHTGHLSIASFGKGVYYVKAETGRGESRAATVVVE